MPVRLARSLVKFTVAASVLSVAALTVSAIPASATGVLELYGAAYNQEIICTPPGTHGAESASARGFVAVANNCGTRVWLEGVTGWTYCISPNTYVLLPTWAQFPDEAGVSTNKNAC